MRTSIGYFDAVVEHGGCVISAEPEVVLSLVRRVSEKGQSATFYMAKNRFDAIMDEIWTDTRKREAGLERVSDDELTRIQSELGVKDVGFRYSNRIVCENCESVYGAFEFIQQGLKEHGREAVETALTMANSAVLRVNPSGVAVCQNCSSRHKVNHHYICNLYGCNKTEVVV